MEPKMWPQPRIVWSTRSCKRQEGASPRASKGSTASPHLHLELLASSTEREYMSVVLKAPSLWPFVTTASGSEYTHRPGWAHR